MFLDSLLDSFPLSDRPQKRKDSSSNQPRTENCDPFNSYQPHAHRELRPKRFVCVASSFLIATQLLSFIAYFSLALRGGFCSPLCPKKSIVTWGYYAGDKTCTGEANLPQHYLILKLKSQPHKCHRPSLLMLKQTSILACLRSRRMYDTYLFFPWCTSVSSPNQPRHLDSMLFCWSQTHSFSGSKKLAESISAEKFKAPVF